MTRTYDRFGRVAAESIPHVPGAAASLVSYTYDLIGRTLRIRRPVSASDSSNHDTTFDYRGDRVYHSVQAGSLARYGTQRRNAAGLIVEIVDGTDTDPNKSETEYEYDAFGNLLETRDARGNKIVLTYNDRGMKMTSSDPDMGNWSYDYYPLGELSSQTDAKGQEVTFTYDRLSRPLTRTEVEGTTEWVWGTSATANNIGQLQAINQRSLGGSLLYSETYSYDEIGRLSNREIRSDAIYDYDYTYDPATGQLDTLMYPASTSGYRLAVQYVYENALLRRVRAGSTTYWQADEVNPFGQVTRETLGNGVVTTRVFDAVTGLLSSIQSGLGGGTGIQNEAYLFDGLGNLGQRQDNKRGLTENFFYDTLNRLDYSELNGVQNLDLSYNEIGNITARSDVGVGAEWVYHGTKKHAVTQAGPYSYSYDDNGNAITRNGQEIKWTSYNYPYEINGPGKKLTFSYGPDRQRYRQVYENGSTTETTIYIGGALEKVSAGGVTDWRHYVLAGGKAVAVVSRKSNGTNTTRYLLEDHQGSVANIVNNDGTSFVSESYAAFGGRRDASDWSGDCPCPDLQKIKSVTRMGYTGHEMIGGHSMGLIHMNGRVQDSVTGRFLSPDPFVPEPFFSQSYNRYTYTVNNPLRYIDPSGFDEEEPPRPPIDHPTIIPPFFHPCIAGVFGWCEPADTPGLDSDVLPLAYHPFVVGSLNQAAVEPESTVGGPVFGARNFGTAARPYTLEEPVELAALRRAHPELDKAIERIWADSFRGARHEEELLVYQSRATGRLLFNTTTLVPDGDSELTWANPGKPYFPHYRGYTLVLTVHTHPFQFGHGTNALQCYFVKCAQRGPSDLDIATSKQYPYAFHMIVGVGYRGLGREYYYYGERANIDE